MGLDEDESDHMFSSYALRNKQNKQESRGRSKFFSAHETLPPQSKSTFESSDSMMGGLLAQESDSSSKVNDPLQAIFANSSAVNQHNQPTKQTSSFSFASNNSSNNSTHPPRTLEMTDVSSIEQELLKGRHVDTTQADHRVQHQQQQQQQHQQHSSNTIIDNIFAKFQQPPAQHQQPIPTQQTMPMRIGTGGGAPNMQTQYIPPNQPYPQQSLPPQNQQYINPYQQYMHAQFLKQQQVQQQQIQQQQQHQQHKEEPREEKQKTTQAKTTPQKRNQFVPPQISKSIGKTIKPKKQTQQPQPQQQQQTQSGKKMNEPVQSNLVISSNLPPVQAGISQPPMSPQMNPNYMMQQPPMQHMPNVMYNSGGFPQQWFNFVGQQGSGVVPNTGIMPLPSDALSVEDLERNMFSHQ
jgi:hypothetical protein